MNKNILNVTVSNKLKKQAVETATRLGFSSLQSAVRVFMSKLASGSLEVTFIERNQRH